jgi:flavin-dependent dehydrogenase
MVIEQTAQVNGRAYPVILGAGLTGLAISRSLSAAGIRHMLVGAAPDDRPRLGESLNAEGSVEIARQFPALTRFFFDKQRQAIFFGKQAVATEFLRYEGERAYVAPMGYPANVRMIHIDRVGFDRALFDLATGDDHCRFVEDQATGIEVSRESGVVRVVKLKSGRSVSCTYVFDATTGTGFLSPRLGLKRSVIGEKRRVVFAHYRRSDVAQGALEEVWGKTTSLLRMDGRKEAVDALAWCIPLGDYVSVGLSVDPTTTSATGELLLDWLEKAYAARGIDVRAAFSERGAVVDFLYGHYDHARCSGVNWLLAGPSCCQFWFPTASGVATGLIAARLAPAILRDPLHGPLLYQRYIDRIAAGHSNMDWMAYADPATIPSFEVQRRGQAMSAGNVTRFCEYVGVADTPAGFAGWGAVLGMYKDDRLLASRFGVDRAGAQAGSLFTPNRALSPWMDAPMVLEVVTRPDDLGGPQSILGVVDALSGRGDAGRSAELVIEDVQVQIDQFQLRGVAQWTAWVAWLRGSRRVNGLELVPASLVNHEDDWVLTAQWQGNKGGAASISPQFSMTFRMEEDRIAEVQTCRADHAFVTGDAALPQVAYAAMLGQMMQDAAA